MVAGLLPLVVSLLSLLGDENFSSLIQAIRDRFLPSVPASAVGIMCEIYWQPFYIRPDKETHGHENTNESPSATK